MPFNTDERLKSYLDTNQLRREQLCLAVLATDRRFSDVRPRHPRGGPDEGRDIEARFENGTTVYAAVGFMNQANDSNEQKRRVRKKFTDDLANALSSEPKPQAFVFFTNINLTATEKDGLTAGARAKGLLLSEIFDRERVRIALDGVDGLAIRFQYLDIPLSEAEQATFFARWGSDIQCVISTGFQRVEGTLDRLIFLQEASNILNSLMIVLQLDGQYPADEIGHFRAFCRVLLRAPVHKIWGIIFGSCDIADRMYAPAEEQRVQKSAGIKHGIAGGNWEQYLDFDASDEQEKDKGFHLVARSSGIGMDPVEFITMKYSHDDSVIRFRPRLTLRDLDEATLMPIMNRSLSEKLLVIHIYANGYKLREIEKSDFMIDPSSFDAGIPVEFSGEELSDVWVRIRPSGYATAFQISFDAHTPLRLFTSEATPDSLAARRKQQTESS